MLVCIRTSDGDWWLYKGEFRKEKLPRTGDGTRLEGGGYLSTHYNVPRAVVDLRGFNMTAAEAHRELELELASK